jgi:hypothetical protein
MLRDQRVIAGIGRAWANEILHHAKLSPFALSKDLDRKQVAGLSQAIETELERGLELRERGANDARTYRVHDKLNEPCYVCGAPIARVDYEEHTVYYCPDCQTGGRVLKDRRNVAAAALKVGDTARRSRRISARDIELFTELTGDRNPLHYDEEAARGHASGG